MRYNRGMHIYQKHILDRLRTAKKLRYSEMQPNGVESSHFKYHLDALARDGLVNRVDRGVYALTSKGQLTVDRLSENRVNPYETPKVITYTLMRKDDLYCLFRKRKEPFLGTLNMVSGKVHLDEDSFTAAKREVHEKAGIHLDDIQQQLVAEVRIRKGDKLISHFIAYVFTANITESNKNLEEYLLEDLTMRDDLAPDLLQILEAINDGRLLTSIDCSYES